MSKFIPKTYTRPTDEPEWDLTPNKFKLDDEWGEQPRIYHFYNDRLADAKKELAEEKSRLEVIEAEISLGIRRSKPKDYGLEKFTEDSIKSLVTTHQLRKEQQARIIEAEHSVDILKGTVKTLEQRKDEIEDLIVLHGRDYFATPTIKQTGQTGLESQLKQSIEFEKKRRIRSGDSG